MLHMSAAGKSYLSHGLPFGLGAVQPGILGNNNTNILCYILPYTRSVLLGRMLACGLSWLSSILRRLSVFMWVFHDEGFQAVICHLNTSHWETQEHLKKEK